MRERQSLTRRGVLALTAGAGFGRLYAFAGDFWNKKDPAKWSSEEIDQLTSKSPWAKDVNAQFQNQGGTPQPGVGAATSGNGPGLSGGGGSPLLRATVRWESAKVVLDAFKRPLPEAFSEYYVLSVNGIPVNAGSRRKPPTADSDSAGTSDTTSDLLERLKGVTSLEPKGRHDLQPGIVQKHAASTDSVLFGFSKELLAIKPDDKEVTFTTQIGRVSVKARFILREMIYHGELAV
jgi:hypothetical protein